MSDEQHKVDFPEDGSIIEGSDGAEVVVHDKDEDGNTIGWHKATVGKGAKN